MKVIATNAAHSWIDQGHLQEVVDRLDFLVVQDMYHTTETAQIAEQIHGIQSTTERVVGEIGRGLLSLVGVGRADDAAEEEARKAREEREARVPEVVQEKARAKVEVQEAAKVDLINFRKVTENKMAGKRQELIKQLDDILKQNPPDAEKPELLFQKAELQWEEARYEYFQKRKDYEKAVEQMLARTDHKRAPWHVVAGDDKRWARVDVVRTVNEAIESALTARGIDPDPPLHAAP